MAPAGLDSNNVVPAGGTAGYRDRFWAVIAQYSATYFCGHEHIPNVQQFADPTGVSQSKPYQVLVGSGGSPFDDKLVGTCPTCSEPVLTNPYDRYYAWALVEVHQSGKVSLTMSGFSDGLSDGQAGGFGPVKDLSIYDVPSLQ